MNIHSTDDADIQSPEISVSALKDQQQVTPTQDGIGFTSPKPSFQHPTSLFPTGTGKLLYSFGNPHVVAY